MVWKEYQKILTTAYPFDMRVPAKKLNTFLDVSVATGSIFLLKEIMPLNLKDILPNLGDCMSAIIVPLVDCRTKVIPAKCSTPFSTGYSRFPKSCPTEVELLAMGPAESKAD